MAMKRKQAEETKKWAAYEKSLIKKLESEGKTKEEIEKALQEAYMKKKASEEL